MRLVKTFTSQDGKRRLKIVERNDGSFVFEESYETMEDYSDYMDFGWITIWQTAHSSGPFDSADEAECEARTVIAWLGDLGTQADAT